MLTPVRPTEPTAAERVRSLIGTATSLRLTTDGHRAVLIGSHEFQPPARLLLDIPADSHLIAETACGPGGGQDAVIEFTDVAPVATLDRVRAHLTLHGRIEVGDQLMSGPTRGLRFDLAEAVLEERGRPTLLRPQDLAGVEPDPLADTEAGMLLHLVSAHPEAIARLTRLVEPRLLSGVTRVDPLRLDRYGIVLRLRRARGHHDVRLGFPEPARDRTHAGEQMRTLVAQATTAACHRHRHGQRPSSG